VSDNLHTSYTDVLNLAFQDRVYLIECINEKKAATAQAMEELQRQHGVN
jgi:hypothetical protein